VRDRNEAGGDRGGGAAARTAGVAASIPRGHGRPDDIIVGIRRQTKFGSVRLAEADRPGVP
jgi:hypothetical protein